MLQRSLDDPHADHPVRARLRRAAGTAVFLLVVGAIAVLVWPAQWGGSTSLTIVSGHSMDGTFATGDLVIGRRGPVEVGDVVVARIEGLHGHVVHRVVGGDGESGWITRGDDNDWDDPFRTTSDDVIGVVRWRVPGAGRVVGLATSPAVVGAYALIVVGLFLWPDRDEPAADQAAADDTAGR